MNFVRKHVMGLLLFCGLFIALQGAELVLKKGKSVPIIRPDQAIPAEITAGNELSEYLVRLTGGTYPVKSEQEAKGFSGPAIYVGDTAFARKYGIDSTKLDREEWVLRSVKNSLILSGGKPRGTYYAVLEFLEKQGVVWPDETTEYIPSPCTITVKDWNIQGKPAIAFRRITLGMSTFNETTKRFAAHSRRNDLVLPESYGFGEEMGGCHTFHDFTSPDWPDEYFGLSNGKRLRSVHGGGPGQLCMSNRNMQKAVLAKLRQKIAADRARLPKERWPRIYDISQNDNESPCTCQNCREILKREGAYSGILLEFINYVADGIAEEYPDILIQTFAYCHTLKPPKNIRPSKNVLIRVCKVGDDLLAGSADTMSAISAPCNKRFAETLARWAEISNHICIWDYWILYNKNATPYVNVQAIHSDILTYKKYKANNILAECESPESTSFSAFKQWLGYQQMVHPEYSLKEQIDKFFNAYYGVAAPVMKEYLHYLESRMAEMKIPLAKAGILSVPYMDRAFFEKANRLFETAEKAAAGNELILARIGYERVPVDAALLGMRTRFSEPLPSGGLTLSQLFERYRKNLLAHVAYYFKTGEAYSEKPGVYEGTAAKLDAQKQVFSNGDLQLPDEYRKRLVCDINWSYGNRVLFHPMKDAFSGKALRLPDGKNYHRFPVDAGIYDEGNKKSVKTLKLGADKIPQDEKFHYYSFGVQTIRPQMLCWIHWTWRIGLRLDYAYNPDTDNRYEILFSMKVTGEPYVKGSKSKAGIYVDRILVLSPGK